MNFKELLIAAKRNDSIAFGILLEIYMPLLKRYSCINGVFDEDLWQEQCLVLWRVIRIFDLRKQ